MALKIESKEIVIDINAMGQAEAMHFDAFPLSYLGNMEVRRASEIMFNTDTQRWDIHYFGGDGNVIYCQDGFKGYDEARGWEVYYVQKCRKMGLPLNWPTYDQGDIEAAIASDAEVAR